MSTAFQMLKADFVQTLTRLIAEAERSREVLANGTCRMTRNGEDITQDAILRLEGEIAELSGLIIKIESEPDA